MNKLTSFSKSIHKALGCERFFHLRYNERLPLMSTPAAAAGTEFHQWRQCYIGYLREEGKPHDRAWASEWLASSAISQTAAELVAKDIATFQIDPDKVFGSEYFISVDKDFNLLEQQDQVTGARRPMNKASAFHGISDYIEVDGDTAKVSDSKTSYSGATDEYEATHYTGLLFAAVPYVQYIEFSWNLVRAGAATVPVSFSRKMDQRWIEERMTRERERMLELVDQLAIREARVDPTAGLCPYCPYTCPLRTAVQQGLVVTEPLQTEEDAIAFAQRVYIAQHFAAAGRELVTQYLEAHGSPLALGNNLVAHGDVIPTERRPGRSRNRSTAGISPVGCTARVTDRRIRTAEAESQDAAARRHVG